MNSYRALILTTLIVLGGCGYASQQGRAILICGRTTPDGLRFDVELGDGVSSSTAITTIDDSIFFGDETLKNNSELLIGIPYRSSPSQWHAVIASKQPVTLTIEVPGRLKLDDEGTLRFRLEPGTTFIAIAVDGAGRLSASHSRKPFPRPSE